MHLELPNLYFVMKPTSTHLQYPAGVGAGVEVNGVGGGSQLHFGHFGRVGIEQKSEQKVFDIGDADVILAHVDGQREGSILLADVQKRLIHDDPKGENWE